LSSRESKASPRCNPRPGHRILGAHEQRKRQNVRSSSNNVFSCQLRSIHSTVTICGTFLFVPARSDNEILSADMSVEILVLLSLSTTTCVIRSSRRSPTTRAPANLAMLDARLTRCGRDPDSESRSGKCRTWPLNSHPCEPLTPLFGSSRVLS
jgi:hypothetical protein